MNWNDLKSNWYGYLRALLRRFPHVDPKELNAAKDEPEAISKLLAQSHDLTQDEAQDELANFILAQSLARTAADFRSHDPRAIAAE